MTPRDIDMSRAVWQKSTRSGGNGGQCVEVAVGLPNIIAVRDSKNPEGPRLVFTPTEWQTFLASVRSGTFDLS